MKHTTLRSALALLLTLALALSLTACGSGSQNSGTSGKLDTTKTDADTAKSNDTDAADDWQGYSEQALAALDDLIAHGQQEHFAAAVLGEREKGDTASFSAWLHNTNPFMASIWPFLTEIPEADIIGDHGKLYCVVPLVESACVTVKSVEWNYEGNGATPTFSDPLYCGEVGKPFLMYVNYSSIDGLWDEDPDTIIEYQRDDGFVASWFPQQEGGCIFRPYYDGHDEVMDFSLLYDVGDYIPYLDDGPDGDSEWLPPTDLGLSNTTWYSDNGWVLAFGSDGSAEDGMVLYQPAEDGTLSPLLPGDLGRL